ncbi:hypothetical protein C8R45DRAFT_939750 [Mycena sanguinolenta]|nr:hypothetical protein C8R45DRAFT_939750 [Mycena sanguinolenta]
MASSMLLSMLTCNLTLLAVFHRQCWIMLANSQTTEGIFPRTLHKIHTFVQAQQGNSKIKHFFQQNQMSALLKDCRAGLQLGLDNFTMISQAALFHGINEMCMKTQHMHAELLEMISAVSDSTISDYASSIQTLNKSQASSQSLSLLPSMPQIFHGRESELTQIVQLLNQQCAKIAILGPGGIGKTDLARAALHHPDVAAKYEDRLFVSCESATTSVEIAGSIGAHLGLNPGKNLTKAVLHSLSRKSICLLVLDNLETTWEPLESRSGTEDLLSSLTDIPHLALIVTMRGAEHPAKVRWTQPFLPALGPLSLHAAQQMFKEIAEDYHKPEHIDQLLKFSDNMPLAVDLIANLVAYEGCLTVLAQLETEKTSLLSEGSDKRSNLDVSIALSITSHRLTARSGAMDLLQLLSILPDGLSDVELIQSNLVIPQIRACKSVLLSTSLAYTDNKKRLKSLVPIREYLQHFHPVAPATVQPLQRHFQSLLDTCEKFNGSTQVTNIVKDIALNRGNIYQVLSRALTPQNPDLPEIIRCIIFLNGFVHFTGHAILPPRDHKLAVQFTIGTLLSDNYSMKIEDHDLLVSEAKAKCQTLNDPALEGRYYCWQQTNNWSKGIQCLDRALTLARDTGNLRGQCDSSIDLAMMNWRMGKYNTSQELANKTYILAQLCGNCHDQAIALSINALCAKSLGNLQDSLSLTQTARELLGLCGLSQSVVSFKLSVTVATTHMEKSEYAEAQSLFIQLLSEMSPESDFPALTLLWMNLAKIDVATGASKQDVLQNLEMAKAALGGIEYFFEDFYHEAILSDLKLREGDTVAARNSFERCLHWSLTRHAQVSSYCLERMADISRWDPVNFDWASTFAIVYLAFSQKREHKLDLYKALSYLGDMFLFNGDELTAESLFIIALEAFMKMDVHHQRAKCMLRLGNIAQHQGDMSRAERQWRDARPLFERSLQAKDIVNIDSRLASVETAHEVAMATLAKLQAPTQSLTEFSSSQEQPAKVALLDPASELPDLGPKIEVQISLMQATNCSSVGAGGCHECRHPTVNSEEGCCSIRCDVMDVAMLWPECICLSLATTTLSNPESYCQQPSNTNESDHNTCRLARMSRPSRVSINATPHSHNRIAHRGIWRTGSGTRRDVSELEWHEGTHGKATFKPRIPSSNALQRDHFGNVISRCVGGSGPDGEAFEGRTRGSKGSREWSVAPLPRNYAQKRRSRGLGRLLEALNTSEGKYGGMGNREHDFRGLTLKSRVEEGISPVGDEGAVP